MIQKGALHNRSTCRNKEVGKEGCKLRALNILNLQRNKVHIWNTCMWSQRGGGSLATGYHHPPWISSSKTGLYVYQSGLLLKHSGLKHLRPSMSMMTQKVDSKTSSRKEERRKEGCKTRNTKHPKPKLKLHRKQGACSEHMCILGLTSTTLNVDDELKEWHQMCTLKPM